MSSSSTFYHLGDLQDFDPHKLALGAAKDGEKGGQSSLITYDGKAFYATFPESQPTAIRPYWKFGLPVDQQTESNIYGYQFAYNLGEENGPVVREFCDKLSARVHKLYSKVSGVSKSASALVNQNGFKPIYSPPKADSGYTEDSIFFKLKYYERKLTTKIDTLDDNDKVKPCSLADVREKYATITPLIHIKDVYLGAHGESGYGGSIRMNVHQINWLPSEGLGPSENVLPPMKRKEKKEKEDEVPSAAKPGKKAQAAKSKDKDFESGSEPESDPKPTKGKKKAADSGSEPESDPKPTKGKKKAADSGSEPESDPKPVKGKKKASKDSGSDDEIKGSRPTPKGKGKSQSHNGKSRIVKKASKDSGSDDD